MSIGFLLNSRDDAVVWRGPKKNGMYMAYFLSTILVQDSQDPSMTLSSVMFGTGALINLWLLLHWCLGPHHGMHVWHMSYKVKCIYTQIVETL